MYLVADQATVLSLFCVLSKIGVTDIRTAAIIIEHYVERGGRLEHYQ
jgi:hypothetical protein